MKIGDGADLAKSEELKYQRLAESYMKKYKSQFQALEHSILARSKSLNEFDVVALGKQLETFEDHVALCEANGSVSNLGPLPKIGLDIITATFGVSPLAVVCGVQPIDEPVGLVWFKDVLAQNTRGNVTAGQKVISPLAMPEVFPENYASDTFINTNPISAADGAQSYSNTDLSSDDLTAPIDPERCVVRASAVFNSGADEVTFPEMIVNPSNGRFSSAAVVNSNLYSVYGSINFTTGVITSLQFSANPSGQTDVYVDFAVLAEEGSDLQKNLLQLQAKTVKARFFALKSSYGFAQSFMMQKRWGLSAEDDMTRDLTSMLNNEIFNIVLAKIIASIPESNASITWGRQPGSGTSYYEHIMTLPSALSDANALMIENLGRGSMNVLIAGNKASAVIEQHPDFQKVFDDDTLGPHVFGNFMGKPVVRVPSSIQLATNKIIGLYKGKTPFEAPVAYCPYMPLTLTEIQGTGANPLQRQRAAAIWAAVEAMIVNGLVEINVDQTSFDYGSGVPES